MFAEGVPPPPPPKKKPQKSSDPPPPPPLLKEAAKKAADPPPPPPPKRSGAKQQAVSKPLAPSKAERTQVDPPPRAEQQADPNEEAQLADLETEEGFSFCATVPTPPLEATIGATTSTAEWVLHA